MFSTRILFWSCKSFRNKTVFTNYCKFTTKTAISAATKNTNSIHSHHARIRKFSSLLGSQESTIYALSTGGLRSAVGIVRVSGSSSSKVLQEIGCFPPGRFPAPRVATVKTLYDVNDGSLLDHAMVLWFPGPNSFTGEDCCEFHVHGGMAVINGLLRSINSFEDCRMAEPGEFTRRSFLNGKMDLTSVDGLADLISAETEMQRVQALNQMNGDLARLYETWRDRIAKCLANVEAYIDFGEDENIEADILETVEEEVVGLLEEMKVHVEDARRGERLRNGVLVAILGKPNVGKSSLLNLLCNREAAIVSDIPGTTRDVLQATINVNGYPVLLADTAGIRDSPGDIIETEGIRRALNEAKKADVVVLVVDYNDKRFMETGDKNTTEKWDRNKIIQEEILDQLYKEGDTDENGDVEIHLNLENVLIVGNKFDLKKSLMENNKSQGNKKLLGNSKEEDPVPHQSQFILDCAISCKTLEGYDDFMDLLGSRVSNMCANPKNEAAYITQERYRSHIQNCLSHLKEYLEFSKLASTANQRQIQIRNQNRNGSRSNNNESQQLHHHHQHHQHPQNPGGTGDTSDEDMPSVDFALGTIPLKSAMNSIGCITGHYGTEDILDIIFRDFCIGK